MRMERTFVLFAICLSLVISVAANPAIDNFLNYFRPNVTLGNGFVECEGAPYSGITITALCTDGGENPPRELRSSTGKDGFFEFLFFTDYPEFRFNPNKADCIITLVEPAVIESDCCKLDLAVKNSKLTTQKSILYTAPAGCVKKIRPSNPEPVLPPTPECPLASIQTIDAGVTVYTIQDVLTFPENVQASDSFSECSKACRRERKCHTFSYSSCGRSCTFYPKGAIALSEKDLIKQGYEPAIGPFICPTVVAICNRTAFES